MRRETTFLMIPVFAAGLAMLGGRRRTVPALRVTKANGEVDVVRTSQVMLIRCSHSDAVTSHPQHVPMSTLWVTGNDLDIDVMQQLDQFRPFIEGFVELHDDRGPVFINPVRVTRIRASGMIVGATPENLRPTTEITFDGGRKLIVNEAPEHAASALGRAA